MRYFTSLFYGSSTDQSAVQASNRARLTLDLGIATAIKAARDNFRRFYERPPAGLVELISRVALIKCK